MPVVNVIAADNAPYPFPMRDSETGTTADTALSADWAERVQTVGFVPFVAQRPKEAAQRAVDAAVLPGRTRGEHLHLANAYSIALARRHPQLDAALRGDHGWNLPDGKPVSWVSAIRGDGDRLRQVRGPQFMLDVIDLGRAAGVRHYLLGGSEETLALLQTALETSYPGVTIVGSDSPPFRPPTSIELLDRDARIAASGAEIVWVGLGTPKQDIEALRLASTSPVLAIAVGAAFDFAAGTVKPAPEWVGAIGFEWLWRMLSEPRRLWRRYTFGNMQFIAAVLAHERMRRSGRAR